MIAARPKRSCEDDIVEFDDTISAGMLTLDADGRVNARFDTPPDLPRPVAMAVTLEPKAASPRRPATSISSASRTDLTTTYNAELAEPAEQWFALRVLRFLR